MSPSRNRYLLAAARLFLGGMFVYAAVPKILDPFSFAVDVYNYKILPGFAVGLVAAMLPWLELTAGIMLVAGIRIRAAAFLVTAMLAVFTIAMLVNVVRGIDVDCGCFAADRSIGLISVAEDVVFTLLGAWFFLCGSEFFCIEPVLRRSISSWKNKDRCQRPET